MKKKKKWACAPGAQFYYDAASRKPFDTDYRLMTGLFSKGKRQADDAVVVVVVVPQTNMTSRASSSSS